MPLRRQRGVLCLVTDRRCLSADSDACAIDRLVDLVAAAAAAEIDLIQIRERELDARDLVTLVARCVGNVAGSDTRVIVNDRADVAMAAGAHGVHLRADSIAGRQVRQLLGADAIVGRSVHGPAEAISAASAGDVDYLVLGTMFDTASKGPAHPTLTMGELAAACRAVSIPVLAIGGMTVRRAEAAAHAGAGGVAAIRLFLPPAGVALDRHLRQVAAEVRRVFDTCGTVP
jgi:thiamine-phosphate diphosphorylase